MINTAATRRMGNDICSTLDFSKEQRNCKVKMKKRGIIILILALVMTVMNNAYWVQKIDEFVKGLV